MISSLLLLSVISTSSVHTNVSTKHTHAHSRPKTGLQRKPSRALGPVRSALLSMNFQAELVDAILNDPRLLTPVTRFQNSGVKTWSELEAKLLSPEWVAKGRKFLEDHKAILERSEKQFGWPKENTVGVLTIESRQGEFLGDWYALPVLYKRFLAHKAGSREDLVYLAKFCLETHAPDCLSIAGSSTGAIGFGQFMPNNIPRFGVDANGDGIVNPFDVDDAILSTANFLGHYRAKKHCIRKHANLEPVTHALVHYWGAISHYQQIVNRYEAALTKDALVATR
jgi:membrane-bound lytic murein transglycosylase B